MPDDLTLRDEDVLGRHVLSPITPAATVVGEVTLSETSTCRRAGPISGRYGGSIAMPFQAASGWSFGSTSTRPAHCRRS